MIIILTITNVFITFILRLSLLKVKKIITLIKIFFIGIFQYERKKTKKQKTKKTEDKNREDKKSNFQVCQKKRISSYSVKFYKLVINVDIWSSRIKRISNAI